MVKREETALVVGWERTARRVFISVLMLSLVITLATRTFYVSIPHGVTVQSGAAEAVRQHLDRDAAKWIPPAAVLFALQAPTFHPHLAPAESPLGALLLDDSLYNRPPPCC